MVAKPTDLKTLHFDRFVLACVAAALLAGCGGSQPPIGTPGAMPQSRSLATYAEPGGSWMLPEARGEDLLYAAAPEVNEVFVLSYGTGKRVGTLTGFHQPLGLCSDAEGDVWIVNSQSGFPSAVEYAHGGTTPIATLTGMYGQPSRCSVEQTTGNLAVLNWYPPSVAIYAQAQGQPTIYKVPSVANAYYCAYDGSGNLYVSGITDQATFSLAEMLTDRTIFTPVVIQKRRIGYRAELQWDGSYVAIVEPPKSFKRTVFRVSISDGIGKVVDSRTLVGSTAKHLGQPWIGNGNIIFDLQGTRLQQWNYPKGGTLARQIHLCCKGALWFSALGGPGVALSVAPSH